MEELRELLLEASRFNERRKSLALKTKDVDVRYAKRMADIESEHEAKIRNYESERQTSIDNLQARTKREIADYVQMKNGLREFVEPVRQWCHRSEIDAYMPSSKRINDAEVNKLLNMLQEEGVLAWLKRTFKLGGYSSRSKMAIDLYKKIEDACAFCDEKIENVVAKCEEDRNKQVTETRRKISSENEKISTLKRELEIKQKEEKAQALQEINRFDNSNELRGMHQRLKHLQEEAYNAYAAWGKYSASTVMPEKVLLCDAKVFLPNDNGIEEEHSVPIWIDLYKTNVIVISSERGSVASTDGEEKQFLRKLLARMIKSIPPTHCSYSVFDPLHKGASLERLIELTNVGTTELKFDLFTSNESDEKTVSCAERRKYLRSRPAEIVKFTAGRSKSLFEYNREYNDFEFPFSWYIDFNFPDNPDQKFLEDIKELFINADTAGYSFAFVTNMNGYNLIKDYTQKYTNAQVIHIDVDNKRCTKGELSVTYMDLSTPQNDQIYNFMTALKKYYEEGDSIDNRIESIFATQGVSLRSAAKKLTIPMAIDSRGRLIDLELGGEGSVHGFISGGTNSGKSTLLHTIILSACLHYHPKDLEIWLVDYKQTEFHLYKKNTLPHIKLIGVSKTADFTFSLLDKIEEEANHRTELMNRFDVQNLADYRRHEGEPGYENIPRLFIIIDEFHEMSQFVSTETEYKDKLENILREYRAQGITCLMADQTFSTGLSGLTSPAKNQIGLRIAMRNEASPQEIKDTLEVDRALYSDSMQRTIAIMSQGEFIMKVYVRNMRGELTDIKLEKFKGLLAKADDIVPISEALKSIYKGMYSKDILYVNTQEQVAWDDEAPIALDRMEPLRYPNARLYLGRSATLRPCFGLDIGRQPDENVSIVGGAAHQRWELLVSIMKSCKYKGYRLLVFMAEYSDLMSDFAEDIRSLCHSIPNARLFETYEEWCAGLEELDKVMENQEKSTDIFSVFIGLEIANIEFERLHANPTANKPLITNTFASCMLAQIDRKLMQNDPAFRSNEAQEQVEEPISKSYNALPIIDKLFASGARYGIRCVAEFSVYRQYAKILKIKDMCRHKIAFNMSAEDCMMYLGNSSFQKSIGQDAVYNNGSKEVKKLLPYRINKVKEKIYES